MIISIFLFSIPEALTLFYLAYSLLGKKAPMKRLVVMSVIFGVTIYLNRQSNDNYILSVIFSCVLSILLLKIVGSLEIYEAITSGVMSLSVYLAIEFINVITLQTIMGIDPTTMETDLTRRFLWFLPQIIATLALSNLIRYFINHYGNRKCM
ncbi:hypothetical protein [Desulfitobacterium sp.]|uniref:hypothetical protein n=1 Tax=Desulfitobacterium sp. TaxID=49981 RepID=UPI002B21B98F|nr:hypothetical protein [Desulfitobacterium sp.]MEA4902313.1 hypothetical protein [Desulfitobacterium sp.]